MGSKGGLHSKILAVHPSVDDESDVLHVDAVVLAEFLRDASEGLEQRFFPDGFGLKSDNAYQFSTPSGR